MNLICGINPVLEALGAGTRHFDRLLIVKGLRNRRIFEAIARATRMGIPLRFEGRETLDRMAGGVPHQGLIAVVSAKPLASLESILEKARRPPLLVVLDGVEDPRNLGAILRTAEAAAVDGVLLPERHSAGLSESVARSSAGALEYVPVARIGNVAQALESLKQRGLWIVGFDASGTERWDSLDFKRPLALVLGGEGRGIRRLVRERCDHVASLPLFGHVASLNVSVAAGIALYEVIRQRGSVPSHVRPIPVRPAPVTRRIVGPAPGDQERDPGALEPATDPRHAASDAEDEALDSTPLSLVRLHDEDVAWSPSASSAADDPASGPRRRGEGAGRGSPRAEQGEWHLHAEGAGRSRRRGRHRRRREGARDPMPAGNGGSEAGGPAGQVRPTNQAPEAAGSSPLPRAGRRRRRRRRR
jgi:23S rRNA (guanosine2251-2'-O)-methyltransferase